MNKMISKKEIKYLASLKQKKFRTINDEYIIEGEKLILDALKHKQPIKKIIYSKKGQHFDIIRKKSKILKIELCLSTEKDAQKISDTKNSQQIFALLKCIQLNHLNLVKTDNKKPMIIIDGISDPGNMGTILRTCSWFGCYNIILTNNSVELYNPKTVRAAMGAHFHLENIYKDSIPNIISYLEYHQYQILTADLKGKNIENFIPNKKYWALILGNESNGISKEFQNISEAIHIPGKGKMESLNVAEAASIVIHYLSKK
jgi:TrmH family RNA methyltransferase